MGQKEENQIPIAEVQGSMLNGAKNCCSVFLFSRSKAGNFNIAMWEQKCSN